MTFRHAATRRTALVLAAFLTMLGTTSTASAYWTARAGGAAVVGTATLGAPTGVEADATGATITVAWNAPTTKPAGVTTLTYRVIETTSDAVVCSTDAAGPRPQCAFTAGAPGAYRFTVTAVLRSWTATSAESNEVAVSPTSPVAPGSSLTPSAPAVGTAPGAGDADRDDDPLPGEETAAAGSASGSAGAAPEGSGVPLPGPDGGVVDEGAAVATGPQVTSVSPSTVASGTSATVTISGTGLGSSTLSSGSAAITTGEQSYSDDTGSITVTVTVGAVAPGRYDLTVSDADGGTVAAVLTVA
jgi:trimeric autotransporter adhesin